MSTDHSFEEMSFEKQKEVFIHSPFSEKGDLLLRSEDPDALARALSSEEMYLITRGMDQDMRVEILKHANLNQLFFMSDLDCWQKDRIDPKGFLDWLDCLSQIGLEQTAVWLTRMDYAMVTAALQKFVQVLKPEWEYAVDEVLGDRAYFSLDGLYYILVNEDNLELIRRAIEVLYEEARPIYVNLMEGLVSDMEYELEEEAYQRRLIRLADRGFPDQETAWKIYQRISPEAWAKLPRKDIASKPDPNEPQPRPANYPVLWSKERLFLDDVLAILPSEPSRPAEALQEELVWLSNKVLATDGIELASEEKVRRSVERVRRFVNIGLEEASGRDPARALDVIKQCWLEFLFRRGFTAVAGLRDDLEEMIRAYWKPGKEALFHFLGSPYGEVCRGLAAVIPQRFDVTAAPGTDTGGLVDFKNLDDIREMRQWLAALEQLHGILIHRIPNLVSVLMLEASRKDEPTTLVSLVGTLFANYVLTSSIQFREIPAKELTLFLEKGFDHVRHANSLKRHVRQAFLDVFLDGRSQGEALVSFLSHLLDEVEDEFRRFSPKSPRIARYISTVKVAAPK